MKTQETANRLVELCRQGKNMQAYEELFDQNAEAIEPAGAPGERTKGIENLKAKTQQFFEDVKEMHSSEISDPIVADNFFTCAMKMDITSKSMGRNQMDEICVYETNNDGKIVKEQFFFRMG